MNDSDNNHNDDAPFSSVDAEVRQALAALRQDNFAAGFEDRALARWVRERAGSSNTFACIERRAWQVLPFAIAASLMLAVYSARNNTTPDASLIARTLGWHSVSAGTSISGAHDTYQSVYSSLYGLPLNASPSGVQ